MSLMIEQQAEEDFSKARNQALYNEIKHFMDKENTNLLSFNEIKQMLRPQNEVYLGMKVVNINDIVGSEGRYRDFDNRFFPKSNHLKQRWERIDKAHLSDIILPPITLYEIAGLYFVRDGNHRVSVAKMQGIENIDAEVISLQSEIKIKKGSKKKDILKQVIQYEKRIFYSETGFGDITDFWDLDFTSPGQYDVIYQHIQIHKYYINEPLETEISMNEAILSWFNKVYMPVIQNIREKKILPQFKGRTEGDMYVWIIKYWDDLKNQYGQDFSLETAVSDFSKEFKETWIKKIFRAIKSKK